LGVLGVLVAGLAAIATYTQPFGRLTSGVVPLYLLAAVGLAPWLATLSRSALGGAVFAVSVPGLLFVTAEFIGTRLYDYPREVTDFTLTFMTATMASLAALGLVLGRRTFAGLEAIEGRGTEVALLPSSGATSVTSPRRRAHPIWLLVKKELRLQQLTWVLVAIYAALYVSIVSFSQDRSQVHNSVSLLTIVYTGVIGILIGALAGGEERQLGVHDAQLLLPMSSRRQWMVKVATSLGFGFLLTIVLPMILVTVLPPEDVVIIGRRGLISANSIMVLPTFVTLGLYVSVVAGSGVRGLIASIPVGMTMLFVFMQYILPLTVRMTRFTRYGELPNRLVYYEPLLPRNAEPYALTLVFGVFLVIVLRLALTNYRWPDRSPLRLARHTAIAIVALTVCFTLLAALGVR
jgi:hypothetical protein